jgi:hypothetical protein
LRLGLGRIVCASEPLSKVLLSDVGPVLLAGLLQARDGRHRGGMSGVGCRQQPDTVLISPRSAADRALNIVLDVYALLRRPRSESPSPPRKMVPRQSDVVGGAIMLAGVLWLLRRASAATSS